MATDAIPVFDFTGHIELPDRTLSGHKWEAELIDGLPATVALWSLWEGSSNTTRLLLRCRTPEQAAALVAHINGGSIKATGPRAGGA